MSGDPTLQDAMAWMRGGALAQDPAVASLLEADRHRRDYVARAVREAFRTEAGQQALEFIMDVTVRRAPVDHRLPTDGEYLRHAQLRLGQNQVLAAILATIDHADRLEAKRHAPAPVPDPAPDLLAGGAGGDGRPAGAEPDPGAWLAFLGDAAGGDAAVTG